MAYLIDSNVVINYVAENYDLILLSTLDNIFDTSFNYSVITIMEVMGYNGDAGDMDKFDKLFQTGLSLGINDAVVAKTISIRKVVKIKLPDAIIAATSIVYDLELLTENLNDFLKVPGLKMANPRDRK